jgi:hypothetical protein
MLSHTASFNIWPVAFSVKAPMAIAVLAWSCYGYGIGSQRNNCLVAMRNPQKKHQAGAIALQL